AGTPRRRFLRGRRLAEAEREQRRDGGSDARRREVDRVVVDEPATTDENSGRAATMHALFGGNFAIRATIRGLQRGPEQAVGQRAGRARGNDGPEWMAERRRPAGSSPDGGGDRDQRRAAEGAERTGQTDGAGGPDRNRLAGAQRTRNAAEPGADLGRPGVRRGGGDGAAIAGEQRARHRRRRGDDRERKNGGYSAVGDDLHRVAPIAADGDPVGAIV